MFPADLSPNTSSRLNRRQFTQLLFAATAGFLGQEMLFPQAALADSAVSELEPEAIELYHVFIGDELARKGGKQPVTFKSGKTEQLKIPANSLEGTKLIVKQSALDGSDTAVILHTLYDPTIDMNSAIAKALEATSLRAETRDRCRSAYHQVKASLYVTDVHAQDILDIVIAGSTELGKDPNASLIRDRYYLRSNFDTGI